MVCPAAVMCALTCGDIAGGVAAIATASAEQISSVPRSEAVARVHAVPAAPTPPGVTEREYLLSDGRVARSLPNICGYPADRGALDVVPYFPVLCSRGYGQPMSRPG